MKITMRGKTWDYYVKKSLPNRYGECDSPTTPNKKIQILKSLPLEKFLSTFIHELTHAGFWDISENAVREYSDDLAKNLLKYFNIEIKQ